MSTERWWNGTAWDHWSARRYAFLRVAAGGRDAVSGSLPLYSKFKSKVFHVHDMKVRCRAEVELH
jgi:hypothetical protein